MTKKKYRDKDSSVILRGVPCDKDMIKTGTPRVFLGLRCQGVKPVDNRVIPWWLCLDEVV